MESKINYTIVGLFVVLLTAGMFVFVYWLGKHGGKEEYDYYLVYMTESVAGLTPDASVKYRGVDVGTVDQIDIDPQNSEQVRLVLKINHGTPVKVDTKAKLKSFGITGLSFIELTGSSKDSALLKQSGDALPVILSIPSTFAQLDEALKQLAEKSTQALEKFNRLLNEHNQDNIASILSETKMLVTDIRGQLNGLEKVVNRGVVMEESATAAFEKIEKASISVKEMADSLRKEYVSVGQDINRNVQLSFDSLDQLLYDLDILAGDVQNTIKAIQESPRDLLFKQSSPKPGPGEEGYEEK